MADTLKEETFDTTPCKPIPIDDPELTLEIARTTRFPSPIAAKPPSLTNEEKIEFIAKHFGEIMRVLGLDMDDPSLQKTPQRVARMYVDEVFSGLNSETFPSITLMDRPGPSNSNGDVVSVRVGFTSFCEHHFVPMQGIAQVAYIPDEKIIGLSKITRVVRYFARRPQLQERLTQQIVDSLTLLLETDHVAVSITATHHCVIARGIEDQCAQASTRALRGRFADDPHVRQEFLNLSS